MGQGRSSGLHFFLWEQKWKSSIRDRIL